MNFAGLWNVGISGTVFSGNEVVLVLSVVLSMIVGYLLGSINLSIIISSTLYRDDIRRHGSGNAGMTNVMRTYGKKMAIITFAGDFLKAVVASVIGRVLFGYYGAALAGLLCFFGHIFPVYYKFKGGKGVVTALAMIIMTEPIIALILFVLFVIIVAITKYVSLGSVVCMMLYPIIMNRMYGPMEAKGLATLIALLMGLMCAFAHRENIKRIMNRTENKLSFKKKPSIEEANNESENEEKA